MFTDPLRCRTCPGLPIIEAQHAAYCARMADRYPFINRDNNVA
jgi:hypothetical protein